MKTAFTASRLFTPLEEIVDPLLLVEDGKIVEISTRAAKEAPANVALKDFGDAVIAPGFVDIHIHGGKGFDVMLASSGEMHQLGKFLAEHGVTAYFPTTVAAPLDQTCTALDRMAGIIEAAQASSSSVEAAPLGIHLEGPFLSHKRRGAHQLENLVEPTTKIFERLWQAARGMVRMLTIAPEIPGAMEVITEAAKRNVLVSIGHSDAQLATAQAAIKAGARHATHTFNAMRPLDHRDPGIVGEVLANDSISADMIVDGIHVEPEVVKTFLRAKGMERAVLITDAMSAAGMPNGAYKLGPMTVDVKDGKATIGGGLAGSVLTMDRAVQNAAKFGGLSQKDAVRIASHNPAQVAGIDGHGKLAAGAEANFVVLGIDGTVKKTIVHGVGA